MSARVAGHTLVSEGAPHVLDERWGVLARIPNRYGGVSGVGQGLCSCGASSPILNSAQQRKQWHREHKAEVAS